MADTPTEGGSDKKPASTRAKKPSAASAASTAKRGSAKAKATTAAAPAKTARAAKPAAAKPAAKSSAKPAAKAPRKASAPRAAKTANGAGPSPAARVAKSVQTGVAAVTPGKKKFAAIAALAGVAAGIATIFGRRKITKAATEAIDAVSGAVASAPAAEDAEKSS